MMDEGTVVNDDDNKNLLRKIERDNDESKTKKNVPLNTLDWWDTNG